MVFASIGKCAERVRAWPRFWRYRDCGRSAFWSYPYAGVSRRPLCQKHSPPFSIDWHEHKWIVLPDPGNTEDGSPSNLEPVMICEICHEELIS